MQIDVRYKPNHFNFVSFSYFSFLSKIMYSYTHGICQRGSKKERISIGHQQQHDPIKVLEIEHNENLEFLFLFIFNFLS
jgi:hypothetical protein